MSDEAYLKASSEEISYPNSSWNILWNSLICSSENIKATVSNRSLEE